MHPAPYSFSIYSSIHTVWNAHKWRPLRAVSHVVQVTVSTFRGVLEAYLEDKLHAASEVVEVVRSPEKWARLARRVNPDGGTTVSVVGVRQAFAQLTDDDIGSALRRLHGQVGRGGSAWVAGDCCIALIMACGRVCVA
jgi:hypothetical protein